VPVREEEEKNKVDDDFAGGRGEEEEKTGIHWQLIFHRYRTSIHYLQIVLISLRSN
jgi:hypothetical protein